MLYEKDGQWQLEKSPGDFLGKSASPSGAGKI
jgi:hypothetical protein